MNKEKKGRNGHFVFSTLPFHSPYSMLYQTHHHPFHFKPSAIPLSPSQVEIKEMACTEVALKGSFRKETALKSNQLEDLYVQNSVEDFSVDDLLDFSKMDDRENEGEQDKSCVSLSSPKPQFTEKFTTHVGNLHDFGSAELNVPVDDVANLEWLSNFVDDSFSDYSLTFPAGNLAAKPKNSPEKQKLTPPAKIPCFACPVPAKARTKRARTGGPRWSFGSSTDSSTSSSNSSTSSISSPSSSWLIYTTPNHIVDSFNSLTGPQTKKPRRRLLTHSIGGGSVAQQPRRCSHCGVQKTPQWRAGPLGAKTLCNACGVRFKSGRLLPEYRPACSPTFSSEVHSNHHRKVLEMRKKKESDGPEPGLGPVASF